MHPRRCHALCRLGNPPSVGQRPRAAATPSGRPQNDVSQSPISFTSCGSVETDVLGSALARPSRKPPFQGEMRPGVADKDIRTICPISKQARCDMKTRQRAFPSLPREWFADFRRGQLSKPLAMHPPTHRSAYMPDAVPNIFILVGK
jgi:hypothetical protein